MRRAVAYDGAKEAQNMQPLNEQQAQRVWSRVLRAQAVPAAGMQTQQQDAAPHSGETIETQLLRLLDTTRAAGALYAHLAGRMQGYAQQQLRTMARQTHTQARTLTAICFLMTGQKPCPDTPECPCVTCISQTLRERYAQELAEAETLRALGERADSFGDALRGLAEEKTCHAQQIVELLKRCL